MIVNPLLISANRVPNANPLKACESSSAVEGISLASGRPVVDEAAPTGQAAVVDGIWQPVSLSGSITSSPGTISTSL